MTAEQNLKDTTVVVVGASRGIGLGIVERLHEAGASVIATARKPDEAASKLPQGVRVEALDIIKADSVEAFAKKVDKIVSFLALSLFLILPFGRHKD